MLVALVPHIITRIISNSCLNVFQKILTSKGNSSLVVNFYTYLGLSILSLLLLPFLSLNFSVGLLINFLIMGMLGAHGNFFIIKALSVGELSSLAPINSYKPIVALVTAFLYIEETPSYTAFLGILLIIIGTYFLYGAKTDCSKIAILYRVLALIFSGTEAVFIKKIILLTNIPTSFLLWAISGLIFSFIFVLCFKSNFKFPEKKYLFMLVLCIAIMQYTTNYIFSKMNVSYALALFQLSTIVSVFLGVNIFHEKGLYRKLTASTIMILGACTIILL